MQLGSSLRFVCLPFLLMAACVLGGCGSGAKQPVPTALPAPSFSPAGGSYSSTQSVAITDSNPAAATFYYTVNGAAPTTASSKYAGPITISTTTTLQAIATAPGYADSVIASATFTITPIAATPVFSLAGGTYTAPQSVTISDTTSGAVIYYTTDGSTPSAASTRYTGPIAVGSSITLNAVAVAPGYTNSAVASVSYILNLTALPTPSFTPAGGLYYATQSITLSDAAAAASIFYTTDGSAPSSSSNQYTGPITVDSSETIRAIAVESGFPNSAVATSTYTISLMTLQPGTVYWGADGHRDKGGPYFYIPLAEQSGESQIGDMRTVFGSSPIFYRAWDDLVHCGYCTNDLDTLQAAGVTPLISLITYPASDGPCDGIQPGFSSFADETSAYNWAHCTVSKIVTLYPPDTYWIVGNEWTGPDQGPILSQVTGDSNLAASWKNTPSYPLYLGAMAGAIAAIKENSMTAHIVGGANGGCGSLGFSVALGSDLASYNGRNLLWDYTNLHWGYDVAAGSGGYNNCGLPSNFNGGKNAYEILAAVGKPVFVDEIDVSNGYDASKDQAAGNNMTSVMADILAHSPATSTEQGVVAGLIYELYQDADIGQPDYFLFTYAGDPATTAAIAAQGTTVKQWIANH